MRLLIIEDEHKIATALKRGFEQEHFAVDVCFDSDEGLDMALSESYDAMIIDRMLPGRLEGLEICKELRSKSIHTPILVLTAKDSVEDKVAGLSTGADDYLAKPFAFEELLARIQALLRRPANSLDTELRYEDIVLNTLTYEVRRGKKTIHLSKREFALLEYFMRNPDRVLTRENIIDHIWSYDTDVLPNTLEVFIRYLRNKIDKPFDGPQVIQTVRGFGYRLGKANE